MQIVFDLRILSGHMHGMARYGLELLKAMLALKEASSLELNVLIARPQYAELLPPHPRIKTTVCSFNPYGFKSQLLLPGIISRLKPDVYHCPFYAAPRFYQGPMVMTIHDLIHLRLPEHHHWGHRWFYELVVKPAALKAKAVCTVSHFSATDIADLLTVQAEKIFLTPCGAGEQFKPLAAGAAAPVDLRLPESYILGVGNAKPHKNLTALVKAYNALRAGEEIAPMPDLIILGVSPHEAGVNCASHNSIHYWGHLSDAHLPYVYGRAAMLVMPSLYEGFGLPALEAMACATPVIASNRASLPEVVGDAGILCEPNPGELARAMSKILTDHGFRDKLKLAGPEQAAKYNWQDTAAKVWQIYLQITGRS